MVNENHVGMKDVFVRIVVLLVQFVIGALILTAVIQQGWKNDTKASNLSVESCSIDESRYIPEYKGQVDYQQEITFTNPDAYSGPVVEGWEPGKTRDLLFYLLPGEETVLLEPFKNGNRDFWCHNTKLIIFQHTRPGSFKARRDNRRTWISYIQENQMVKVFYVVGRASGSKSFQIEAKLREENQIFGDILQVDFIDHANNNTLKTLLTFKYLLSIKWANYFPDFVMKADDDVYINLPLLKDILFKGKN